MVHTARLEVEIQIQHPVMGVLLEADKITKREENSQLYQVEVIIRRLGSVHFAPVSMLVMSILVMSVKIIRLYGQTKQD